MCTFNLCFEVLYKGMYCGYPFEPSRTYEANMYPQSTFLTRGREEFFRLKIIKVTREQSTQVLYTCIPVMDMIKNMFISAHGSTNILVVNINFTHKYRIKT